MNLDPMSFIGSQLEGVVGAPIIIGLPSKQAPVPNFVIGIIPEESAQASSTLSSLQMSAGDLFLKSAINGSEETISFILTQDSMLPQSWITTVTNIVQNLTGIANAIGGGGFPNLSGVSSNYISSQLSALRNIKNGAQPVMILNSYIDFGSIGQNNNNLSSNWYIEDYKILREEAEGGCTVQIKFKELLTKRDSTLSVKSLITNFANEILSPSAGSAIGGLL